MKAVFSRYGRVVRLFFFLTFFLVGRGYHVFAQCTLEVSGVVRDADTRELLSGASILVQETRLVVQTSSNGAYVLTGLCPGFYNLTVTHVGCESKTIHLHVKSDLTLDVQLPHRHNEMKEVVVTGNAKPLQTQAITTLQGAALDARKGETLGEMLKGMAGVSVLQTGNNIYKPVIHGMHSNRVLILNNGIRQEGQQWGNEHAPEIDPYMANRISVIKGAGSLRYGGDAIGGVVLVEPRLLPNYKGIGGEINLAGFSNNRMGIVSGILEGTIPVSKKLTTSDTFLSLRNTPLAWRVQGTLRRGGTARTPDYWLANSGVSEYNFSAALGKTSVNKGWEVYYSLFNTKIGIFQGAHIGSTSDLENIINRGEPSEFLQERPFTYVIDRPYQQVQHHLLKAKAFLNTGSLGRLSAVVSGQYNSRREYDRARASQSDRPQLQLDLTTFQGELLWDHPETFGLRGTIGWSGLYQENLYDYRLFIPNYRAAGWGIFWVEKWRKNDWVVETGIRYDQRNQYDITTISGGRFPSELYRGASFHAGLGRSFGNGLQLVGSFSSAWRAPQVNELFSDGLHHGAARLEKGQADLRPERSVHTMLQFTKNGGRLEFDFSFYHKFVEDFIYLRPADSIQLTIRGAFPVFGFTQTDASMVGADASVVYHLNQHIQATGQAAVLRARDRSQNDWLIMMPADRFELGLTYQFSDAVRWKKSYLKIHTNFVAEQTRVPLQGNIPIKQPDGSIKMASDYMAPPAAYQLLGVEAGTQVFFGQQPIQLVLSVQNLTNERYREYLNAFRYFADDRGRDIALKIKIPFYSSR